uniref:Uncharacterized protein n=1 Tax=Prymnesium polylepis TaxID=72548 RepID=A0A7S4HCG7_9EUKA
MEVEAQVAHFLRFSQPGRALSAARGARSNSGSWQEAARSLATPDTHCAHPSFSTVRSAFLRDSPAPQRFPNPMGVVSGQTGFLFWYCLPFPVRSGKPCGLTMGLRTEMRRYWPFCVPEKPGAFDLTLTRVERRPVERLQGKI